jgi:hypothetical protein
MHVVWTDESKYELFSDGVKWIRRPKNERFNRKYTIPTLKKGGGTLNVWGAFIGGKVGPLHRVFGNMDAVMFCDIIDYTLLPWARVNCPVGWTYQQDNDPKHTSRLAKDLFKRRKLKVILCAVEQAIHSIRPHRLKDSAPRKYQYQSFRFSTGRRNRLTLIQSSTCGKFWIKQSEERRRRMRTRSSEF